MSTSALLDLIIQVLFIALAAFAVVDFHRHRDRIRRDVAVLFGLLAVPFLVPVVERISGQDFPVVVDYVAISALIAEPYALLRVVKYLRSTSVPMMRLARWGMIASIAVVIVYGSSVPTVPTLAVQAYFVGLNIYAMVAFVRGALGTQGVVRQRVRFAAAGSGLLALTLFVIIVGENSFGQVLALVCAIAFYVGFTPPRGLRRMWQFTETGEYLAQLSSKPIDERLNLETATIDLCQAASRAVGGMAAGIVRKDAASAQWEWIYTDGALDRLPLAEAGILGRAWTTGTPDFLRASDPLAAGDRQLLASARADTLLATPIIITDTTWGLLLVFLQYGSMFIEDDLYCVTLLVQQNAIFLANSMLVDRLRNLNAELAIQANQLAAANRELEAFSYSVSHDLRAPLRALNGFSQALEEDYAGQLDGDGRMYLERIRASSQHMGQLIDDLIELSRLSRNEMRHEQVDLSTLARQIEAELREQDPGHEVEFEVEDGLVVTGDARLLRAMLSNLLGNAWKYTGHQAAPRVEFGATEYGGQQAFFVRDNGAGFDMAYADKLFGVFQRLHTSSEFPGNGIGLATVQRVVNRHGGRVWAEAAVNQGATFYFSL
ncbi:sensor histidine kinase [Aggregatilinea lenta]|uniref:sensor histidine kinase n=1 Tax=Aggregatilinea lenta TaxID=913108 RepID=UPI001EE8D5DD|nr:ATP-binding protein [Aggregatilinea lenta]